MAYSNATYRVVRYPDGKVIADAETARKATDVIEMPAVRTAYTYGVVSTVDGLSSTEAKSAETQLHAPYRACLHRRHHPRGS